MADDITLNPAAVPPPIEVDPSSARAVAGTLAGALAILATGLPALLGLVRAHDLVELARWVQGTQGAAFFSAAGLVATVGWRAWVAVRKHVRLLVAARAAPDSVAIVRGDAS